MCGVTATLPGESSIIPSRAICSGVRQPALQVRNCWQHTRCVRIVQDQYDNSGIAWCTEAGAQALPQATQVKRLNLPPGRAGRPGPQSQCLQCWWLHG